MRVHHDQFNRSVELFELSKFLPRLKLNQGIRCHDINFSNARRYTPKLLERLSEWLKPTDELRLMHIPQPTRRNIHGPAKLFVFQTQGAEQRELQPGSVIEIEDQETYELTPDMLSSAVLGLSWRFLTPDPMR